MIRTRSTRAGNALPRRLAPAVTLVLAFAMAILAAACGGGNSTSSFGVGPTTGPAESMGLESAPASSGY